MILIVGTALAPHGYILDLVTYEVTPLSGMNLRSRYVGASSSRFVMGENTVSWFYTGSTSPAAQVVTEITTYDGLLAADNTFIVTSNFAPYVYRATIDQPEIEPFPVTFGTLNGAVYGASLHPNGRLLALTGGFSGFVGVWDIETGERKFILSPEYQSFGDNRIQWSPDGNYFSYFTISNVLSRSPRLVRYNQVAETYTVHAQSTKSLSRYGVGFSAGSQYVFYGTNNQGIEAYRITETGWEEESVFVENLIIYSIIPSIDPNMMYVGMADGVRRLIRHPQGFWYSEPLPYAHVGSTIFSMALQASEIITADIYPSFPAAGFTVEANLPVTVQSTVASTFPPPTLSFSGVQTLIIKAVFDATIDTPTTLLTGKKYIVELLLQTYPRILDSGMDIRTTYLVPFMLENGFSFETDSEISRFLQLLLGSNSGIVSTSTVGFRSEITFQEAIEVLDFSLIEQAMLFLEIMGFDSSESISHAQILALVSEMFARDSSHTAINYGINFAAAIVLRDAFATGYVLSLESSAELTAAFQEYVNYILSEITGLSLLSEEALNLNVQMLVLSDATTTDSVQTQLSTTMLYQSMLNGLSVFRIGDDLFEGWVLNLNDVEEPQVAFSNYSNYPFTSIVEFGGKNYGVAEDGIYLLEGANDAGQPIPATVRTGLINFNAQQVKDAKNFFLGYTSDGQIVLKVITISGSKRREDWYRIKAPEAMDYGIARTKLHRGLRSTYWQFELVSPEGADFQFDNAVFEYQVLSRRIRK